MTINDKQSFIYTLTAVGKDYKFPNKEEQPKEHTVVGEVYEKEHFLVLSETFDGNEL